MEKEALIWVLLEKPLILNFKYICFYLGELGLFINLVCLYKMVLELLIC